MNQSFWNRFKANAKQYHMYRCSFCNASAGETWNIYGPRLCKVCSAIAGRFGVVRLADKA